MFQAGTRTTTAASDHPGSGEPRAEFLRALPLAGAKKSPPGPVLRTPRRGLWMGVTVSFLLIVFAAAGYAQ